MFRRINRILTAAAAVFFVALIFLAVPSFSDPEFEIVNRSSGAVSVVTEWRGNEKKIGLIESKASYQFRLNDEAAMKFKVRYAGGKALETEPIYFSSGVKVIAAITSDGIEVRYGHDP